MFHSFEMTNRRPSPGPTRDISNGLNTRRVLVETESSGVMDPRTSMVVRPYLLSVNFYGKVFRRAGG